MKIFGIKNFDLKIFSLFIYIKRCLKHFGIAALLISIPAMAFVFRGFTEKSTGAAVGLCGGETQLIQNLLKKDGYIHFIEYTDSAEMQNDVETQKLECGFIFPDEAGKLTEIKTICGVGYTSVLADVTQEAVFSELLKIYGRDIAFEFTQKNELGINSEKFTETYNNYLADIKNAISFEETDIDPDKTAEDDSLLHCLTAVVVVCAGLAGVSLLARDRKKGIYYDASGNIAAALLLFDIAVYISFVILGKDLDIIRLLLLNAGVWGLCSLVSRFIRDERVAWMLMPVCIGFAAVFDMFKVSGFVPALKPVEFLLISHYYVYAGIVPLAVVSIALAAA
ncbi:MAG: hypothetical protein IJL89_11125, partial [Firmicutes bacterium]|nr:hypothetical protein [Bacillota bacterium]